MSAKTCKEEPLKQGRNAWKPFASTRLCRCFVHHGATMPGPTTKAWACYQAGANDLHSAKTCLLLACQYREARAPLGVQQSHNRSRERGYTCECKRKLRDILSQLSVAAVLSKCLWGDMSCMQHALCHVAPHGRFYMQHDPAHGS